MEFKKDTLLIILSFILIISIGIISAIETSGTLRVVLVSMLVVMVVLIGSLIAIIKTEANSAIQKVTYMIEEHGNDIFTNMPIGIVSINSSGIILWANDYFKSLFEDTVEKRSVAEFFPDILDDLSEEGNITVEVSGDFYKAVRTEEAIFFFHDTERVTTLEKYNNEKVVMGAISFDNYEDYYNSLDEQRSSEVTSHMSKLINNWCNEFGIYLRKYSNSRYLMIMNTRALNKAKKDNFSILDDIRTYGHRTKLPLTISMSIAFENENINTLAESVFEGLDLVLSRGGDQVAVKKGLDKANYFGGKTDAVEKRNRAKARMFSGSVANLVRKSKDVVIMGHKNPDFDSIGACVGMCKLAYELNPNISVAIDIWNTSSSSRKLLKELEETSFYEHIKHPSEVLEEMDKETILIIVDTHKTTLVESSEILEKSKNTIIIDHHRRGEDVILNPLLSYIEPYASSTSELVTELIEFQLNKVEISAQEATAMLAGIIMDTKGFIYRTGNRTFDAAATLKAKGADTIVIQDLLKEEMDVVVTRNNLIGNIKVVAGNCAITSTSKEVSQVVLAQAADEILKIEGVKAAFVLGKLDKETVSLSARSNGEVNVQLIAESLGGGGHMTAAASQVMDKSIDEVREEIISSLEGGNVDESDISY